MTKTIFTFRSITNAPKKEDETYFTYWKVKFIKTVLSTCRPFYPIEQPQPKTTSHFLIAPD